MRERADALCEHGNILYRSGDNVSALEARRSCVALLREVLENGSDPNDAVRLVAALSNEATLLRAIGDVGGSLKSQEEAAKWSTDLYSSTDSDMRHAAVFFLAHLWHADALNAAQGPPEQERAALDTAIGIARDMTQADPGRMDWQQHLAIALERSAAFTTRHLCTDLFPDKLAGFLRAEQELGEAETIQNRQLNRDPNDTERLRDVSVVLEALAVLLADHAGLEPGKAAEKLDRANELLVRVSDIHQRRLMLSDGQDTVAQHDLALSLLKRAQLGTLRSAPFEESEALFAQAEKMLRALRTSPNAPPVMAAELATLSFARAKNFAAFGRIPQASAALEEAIDTLLAMQAEATDKTTIQNDIRFLQAYEFQSQTVEPPSC